MKSGLDLLVDLSGGLGTRKCEGRKDGKADSEGKERFVEAIDFRFVFRRHGIILTCGI